MNTAKKWMAWLILVASPLLAQNVMGQEINAQSWNTRAANYGYANTGHANRQAYPAYTAPADYARRGATASNWVERDPRYMSALPSSRPSSYGAYRGYGAAATTAYRPPYAYPASGRSQCGAAVCPRAIPEAGVYGGGPVYRGQSPRAAVGYGGNSPSAYPSTKPAFSPYRVPEGYYRGDGIFGMDTVYAENQPVRNFFRYIMP